MFSFVTGLLFGLVLTVLVEELMDGRLLRVEEQSGHVVVGLVGAEELADGGVNVLTAGQLKTNNFNVTL